MLEDSAHIWLTFYVSNSKKYVKYLKVKFVNNAQPNCLGWYRLPWSFNSADTRIVNG